jgi:hypothetical protein
MKIGILNASWVAVKRSQLRARRFDQLDIDNLAEEVESAARAEKRRVCVSLGVIVLFVQNLAVSSGTPCPVRLSASRILRTSPIWQVFE